MTSGIAEVTPLGCDRRRRPRYPLDGGACSTAVNVRGNRGGGCAALGAGQSALHLDSPKAGCAAGGAADREAFGHSHSEGANHHRSGGGPMGAKVRLHRHRLRNGPGKEARDCVREGCERDEVLADQFSAGPGAVHDHTLVGESDRVGVVSGFLDALDRSAARDQRCRDGGLNEF